MAAIKAYTDLEQSRKLEEILPIESADMCWSIDIPDLPTILAYPITDCDNWGNKIPAWSLAALLEGLSKWAESISEAGIVEISYEKGTKWGVSILNCGKIKDCYADNPIDACYEMIIKLHELNLL